MTHATGIVTSNLSKLQISSKKPPIATEKNDYQEEIKQLTDSILSVQQYSAQQDIWLREKDQIIAELRAQLAAK